MYSSDLRSFIHCLVYKLHSMPSWAHLKITFAWEFFHRACSTSARILGGSSMETKTLKMKYFLLSHQFSHVIWSFKSFDIMHAFISQNKWAYWRWPPKLWKLLCCGSSNRLHTLVIMEFMSIHFCQCFVTINFINTIIITRCHVSAPHTGIEQCLYFDNVQETY